jgi:selT/selW/selH-like putative selenoprotein
LADVLKNQKFDSIELIESSGGVFEVYSDGVLLFSKMKEHRFPEEKEIIDLLKHAKNN